MSEPNVAISNQPAGRLPKSVGIPLAVLLILVFIALLFPWDAVARRVAWEIGQASGSRVQIDELAPAWTARGPVLRARRVSIEHPAVEQVRLAVLEIAPRPSRSWLSGEPALRVWADSELGLVDGVLELGASPRYRGDVHRVELTRLPLRLDASGLRLSGMLAAKADVALDPNGTLRGRIDFESDELLIQTSQLPIAIPFTRATGVIEILDNGATRIESVDLEGPILEGQIAGEIGLVHHSLSPPVDLRADLRVLDPSLRQLAPGAGLRLSRDGAASVVVSGTIDAPQITPAPRRTPR